MAEVTDYYLTLGLAATAAPVEIKRAYRAAVQTCHPDRHPGDAGAEERFKAVQRAYHVLSSAERRRAYDDARFVWDGASHRTARDLFQALFFGDDRDAAAFGAGAQGADTETQIRLSFDQALRGGRTEVRLPEGEAVPLVVPRGVRSGLKVRVRGHGRRGAGGARGDLYVTFRVEQSAQFRREGDDLHLVETVSAFEAMLGTVRQITNAYGQTVKVHIPAGAQPGERLRLRGQGVETETRRGDLFVEVRVTVPRALTDRQRAVVEAAAREAGLL